MSIKAAAPAKTARRARHAATASTARTTDKASTRKREFSLRGATPSATPDAKVHPTRASGQSKVERSRVVRALGELEAERARLDRVIARATRGGTFTPAQLLGLQAQIYRLSQDMEITSRVLDRSVGALKSVLSVQV